MTTKARQLAEFIANADVDSDEIATGAVSASKLAATLDLSSKTISLPTLNQTLNVGGIVKSTRSNYSKVSLTNTDTPYEYQVENNGSNFRITDSTAGQTRVAINTTGYFGINTIAPAGRFHVVGTGGLTGGTPQNSGSGNQIVIENNASGGSADIQMLGPTNGYNHIFFGDADDANIGVIYYNHNNNSLNFTTNANTGSATLASNGKFGIGTPTPGDELTVVGQALFSYTDISASSSAQYAQVEIQKDDADANWSYLAFHEVGAIAWQQGILDNKFVIASTGGAGKTSTDVEHFTISASGNVGIGTTSPDKKLTIAYPGADSGIHIQNSSGNRMVALGAYSANEGVIRLFNSSNTETVRIAAESSVGVHTYFTGGNVGIGTTNPTAKLHVDGSGIGAITITHDVEPGIKLNNDGANGLNWDIFSGGGGSSAYNNWLTVYRRDTDPGTNHGLFLQHGDLWVNNNVGIGTNSPLAKLHIQGNAVIGDIQGYETTHPGESGATLHIHDTVGDGGTNNGQVNFGDETRVVISTGAENGGGQGYQGSLWFGTSDHPAGGTGLNAGTQWNYYVAGIASKTTNDTGSQNVSFGNLEFYTKGSNSTSSAALAMTINESQNVGIGTNSPQTPLHIETNTAGITTELRLKNLQINRESRLSFYDENNINQMQLQYDNGGNRSILTTNGNGLTIYSSQSNSEVARFGLPGGGISYESSSFRGNIYITNNSWDGAFDNTTTGVTGHYLVSDGRFFNQINFNSGGSEIILVNNVHSSGATVALLQYRTLNSNEGTIFGDQNGLSIVNASDYRRKENITDLTGSLSKITKLRPVEYNLRPKYGDPTRTTAGFIAHEVESCMPNLVIGTKDAVDSDGNPIMQAVSYNNNEMIATLVGAIKEQQAIIDGLKARIEALEG